MLKKLTENLLSVIVTVVLVAVVAGIMIGHAADRQQAALQPLREQNEALRAQADENRRQMEATAQLLRQAVQTHEGEIFSPEVEMQKLNTQRMDALADAIAKKVTPALPAPQTPEQLARLEDEQVQRIASATADKLQPTLSEAGARQRERERSDKTVSEYRTRLDATQATLTQTQVAAQDALRLTQELSTKYLDTYKDRGALVRLFALPGDLISETAHGNLVSGEKERKRQQQELDAKIQEIERRLQQIRIEAANPVARN